MNQNLKALPLILQQFAVTLVLPIRIAVLLGICCNAYSHTNKTEQVELVTPQIISAQGTQETNPTSAGLQKPYAIIVGAFRSRENAVDLVSYLKAKGNRAAMAGKSTTGLFRVSIQSYSDRDEAYRQLAFVRSNGYAAAWVLLQDDFSSKVTSDTTNFVKAGLVTHNQVSYTKPPDSVTFESQMMDHNMMFGQYYRLADQLKQYREIEKCGKWNTIDIDPEMKTYKPGDSAKAILQIRERLFTTGDLKQNNKSRCYDRELVEALNKYQTRNSLNTNELIFPVDILEMNVPVGELIKKIILNMERYRSISPEFAMAKKVIVVNIPSFDLQFICNGRIELQSPVIVGEYVSKTLIFSGMLSSIVFNPYWNVPQGIIEKEIRPGMAKNKNFLKEHNMEWNNGQLRQKPGKENSLGMVKFIFPNTENIYMHDTPVKSLFEKENRAFSHGCIRVGKSMELAIAILKDDGWLPETINNAINSEKEIIHVLKNKIPVYIGYFTAWVDEQGMINFCDDIYHLDESLSDLLIDHP
jgi:hypothetical protein